MQGPDPKGLSGFADGASLAAGLNPFGERARVDDYAKLGIEALAMEFMPRITRAQSMDILSSQANLAGYTAVLMAAKDRKSVVSGKSVAVRVGLGGRRVLKKKKKKK